MVFDASCKTDKGISLNDAQIVGEKLQNDLHDTLMRFRRHRIAFSADIKMMYRQVKVNPEQWNLQRIFWRENSKEPLKEYNLVVVSFGLASSPHCAIRAMMEGANSMKHEFPNAVKAINQDFYMDDCLTGAKNEEEAIKLAEGMKFVLKKSCFPLCKWRSNSKRLLNQLEGETSSSKNLTEQSQASILGLKWLIQSDEFTFEVKSANNTEQLTKRIVLGKVVQLYDPNGFISPFISKAKMFVQKLWNEKLEWDTPLNKELLAEWNNVWAGIQELEKIRIPRWLNLLSEQKIQLHGFSDASLKAYGAVIYVRIIDENGIAHVNLIASKSRVAPSKQVSVPRLELAAAELLSKLYLAVASAMEWKNVQYFLWCDSTIALQWINKEICDLKIYVANRVSKIRANTNVKNWFHVKTNDNPADLVSRGLSANELVSNSLWWNGPSWLGKPEPEWPKPLKLNEINSPEVIIELKCHSLYSKL